VRRTERLRRRCGSASQTPSPTEMERRARRRKRSGATPEPYHSYDLVTSTDGRSWGPLCDPSDGRSGLFNAIDVKRTLRIADGA
jgi:hypothetical protein